MSDYELGKEAAFWEREYYECFSIPATINKGDPLASIQKIQSAVMRHYVEQMKEVIAHVGRK